MRLHREKVYTLSPACNLSTTHPTQGLHVHSTGFHVLSSFIWLELPMQY